MRNLRARTYATPFSGTVLTLIFATLWTCVATFDLWNPAWEAHEGKEAPVTVRLPSQYFRITMLRNEFHYLSTTSSACPRLVPGGTKLTHQSECAELVKAFESARRPLSNARLAGTFLFYLTVCLVLTILMRRRQMERARVLRAQIALFSLLSFILLVSKGLFLFTALPTFIAPVIAAPLLAGYFFNRRLALTIAATSALLVASLVNFDTEVFMIYLLSGLIAVIALGKRQRAHIHLRAGAMASWVAVLGLGVTTLLFSGSFNIHADLAEHLDPRHSLWISALIGGLASGVIAWLLTPLTGQLVGIVSRSRLLDLQELDQRLLKVVMERAPGTWEHSRAMANLAEAAAHSIHANALLVRVGSYYHDTGKSVRSELFIENQAGGPNPHDDLDPYDSASRIFGHVVEGTRMLRKERLPEDVIEFCYSHHGNSVLEYFWEKNLAAGNPDDLTKRDFRYPGHRPSTREAGILMLVDAIEAAARTVENRDKTSFTALVQQIVFSKLSQGQLDNSGLSVADLRIVSNTLVDTLVNMYHTRIKYPWQTGDTGSVTRPSDERDMDVKEVSDRAADEESIRAVADHEGKERGDPSEKTTDAPLGTADMKSDTKTLDPPDPTEPATQEKLHESAIKQTPVPEVESSIAKPIVKVAKMVAKAIKPVADAKDEDGDPPADDAEPAPIQNVRNTIPAPAPPPDSTQTPQPIVPVNPVVVAKSTPEDPPAPPENADREQKKTAESDGGK